MSDTKKPAKSAKKAESEAKELTLAEGMQELSEIIRQMEEGGRSLEETFALYKEGLTHLSRCNAQIDRVEKELEILEEGGTDD
ncbi:MAG: exodeoxyribonuclease VII small subunit [Lachnospiraceae bacterium]|nr:exodeoxyribonuclease VII small subunit [Lachnospiraceae bacterium]MBQ2031431.1 exodeoxyribonuclease VII small subunit [Lachnospiraceae bacterium]MBQ3979512.1 exodeoxyribonuclease VII small subunit [Lachnospiraceae bacterium]MCR5375717.1 exodeoxyribonuclease VII small subunit [Lachnospiraceae bacterium]